MGQMCIWQRLFLSTPRCLVHSKSATTTTPLVSTKNMACSSGNLPTSIVAVILTKSEHSNGLKILKSICHRRVFSDIFEELHPKSTSSELTWAAEVNGFQVDKPK